MTVARAAPATPSSGKGPMPNMNMGSNTALTRAAIIITTPGVFVSPSALMIPLPTMGKITNMRPGSHIYRYVSIMGRRSSSAFMRMSTGFIMTKPMPMNSIVIIIAMMMLSNTCAFSFSGSLRPAALEIIAVTPVLTPIVRLWKVRTIGNVNDSAASSLVPRRPTKKVSTRLNMVMPRMPNIMGPVILTSCLPRLPCVKSLLLFNAQIPLPDFPHYIIFPAVFLCIQ